MFSAHRGRGLAPGRGRRRRSPRRPARHAALDHSPAQPHRPHSNRDADDPRPPSRPAPHGARREACAPPPDTWSSRAGAAYQERRDPKPCTHHPPRPSAPNRRRMLFEIVGEARKERAAFAAREIDQRPIHCLGRRRGRPWRAGERPGRARRRIREEREERSALPDSGRAFRDAWRRSHGSRPSSARAPMAAAPPGSGCCRCPGGRRRRIM
jgi:hypothetical protein